MSELQALVFIIIPASIALIAYCAVVYHEHVRDKGEKARSIAILLQLIEFPFSSTLSKGMRERRIASIVIFVWNLSLGAFIIATINRFNLFGLPGSLIAFIGGLMIAIVFAVVQSPPKEAA